MPSVLTEISMVVIPSISSSSQTINGVGAAKTGFGSTVRVKFILEIKQPAVKGSLLSTSTRA
ncbi:hypothetical protein [Prochlorococcus sp.]|uniref:hypothetical protein n=1 Tax=Prochlorococcus sp. TaxID=1220 RepID=UPI003F69BC0C